MSFSSRSVFHYSSNSIKLDVFRQKFVNNDSSYRYITPVLGWYETAWPIKAKLYVEHP